jgi:hypothetical protein
MGSRMCAWMVRSRVTRSGRAPLRAWAADFVGAHGHRLRSALAFVLPPGQGRRRHPGGFVGAQPEFGRRRFEVQPPALGALRRIRVAVTISAIVMAVIA